MPFQDNITSIFGHGKFTEDGAVEVNGKKYTAEHTLISTGAKPIILDVPGKTFYMHLLHGMSRKMYPSTRLFEFYGKNSKLFFKPVYLLNLLIHLVFHTEHNSSGTISGSLCTSSFLHTTFYHISSAYNFH